MWVDAGAGKAVAQQEALKFKMYGHIENLVAISYGSMIPDAEIAKLVESSGQRFSYLYGDYIENMLIKGELDHLVGMTDLITDLAGPFTYSKDLKKLTETYLKMLKVGGKATFMVPIRYGSSDFVSVEVESFIEIVNSKNEHVAVVDFFKKIEGVELIYQKNKTIRESRGGPYFEKMMTYAIKKTSNRIRVPNLVNTKYESGGPPKRVYKLLD